MDRTKSNIKFVGLHGHSCVGSPFDGLGFPADHMEFSYFNGSDALALTDHGSMAGLSYQVLHAKKMEKEGKDFKPIYGVEAYVFPSLEQWKEDKERIDLEKKTKTKEDKASFVVEDEEASKKENKDILNHRRHIVLLAQNQKGLNNLFKLVSTSYTTEYYYRFPRMDYKLLKQYSEGIIASSACLGGVLSKDYWMHHEEGEDAIYKAMCQTTEAMLDIFGDRWYNELQWNAFKEQHIVNQFVIRLSKEYSVPLISTADSHYPQPDLWKDRILYKKLGWLNKSDQVPKLPESIDEIGYELYPKNGDQMWEAYKKYSNMFDIEYNDDLVRESLERTYDIAHNRIERFYPDNTVRLPDFVVPEGQSETSALSNMAVEGLKNKGLHTKKEYIDRLKYELHVVNDRKFSKYFLTMKAAVDLIKQHMLCGPGRGSGAGSLLSYVLGITQIDPIKYGLQFERFLRRDATDFPDIDFDAEDKDKVSELLIEKWGQNCVVPISNFNKLKVKSVTKDIAKFLEIPYQDVNEVTSKIDDEAIPKAKAKHNIEAGVYYPTWDEYKEFSPTFQKFLEDHPMIDRFGKTLAGQIRSCSRHAGGLVIGQNLDYHMPLIKSGDSIQTPWSEGQFVRHLEPMGFIKFDYLGLKILRIIHNAIVLILKNHFNNENPTIEDVWKFYDKNLSPEYSDLDDIKVYEKVFHNGNFAATFQFSQKFAQDACQGAKPINITDVATLTSLLRPGAMASKFHDKYVHIRQGIESKYYVCKELEEVTKESEGLLCFQEQIAAIACKLGKDISIEDGNKLRKILTKNTVRVGKRVPTKEEQEYEKKFIEGAIEKNLAKNKAKNIWEQMIKFSQYSFNKSHAVAYSIISYQSAWLLTYFPAEWLAAYLTHVENNEEQAEAISCSKQLGFKIGQLDINESEFIWQVSKDGKTLIPPLVSIKGIGEKAVIEIVANKPYTTIEDLIFNEKISGRAVGKKVLDALIRSGALDKLVDERFSGIKHFWSAVAVDRPKTLKKFNQNIEDYRSEGDFSEAEKLLNVQSLTGNYPVRLVVSEQLLQRLDNMYCPALGGWDPDEPLHRSDSGRALCWFIPFEKLVKKTKNGKEYWILRCVDLTGTVTELKCWGIHDDSRVILHRPHMAALDYDDKWGFSTRNVNRFKVIG